MAEIRFYENIFENEYKSEAYDIKSDLHKVIEDFSFQNMYKDMLVECYDPDTDSTFYASMLEDDVTDALVLINGKDYKEDAVIEDNDIIQVFYLPLSNESQQWQAGGAVTGGVSGLVLGGLTGLFVGGIPGLIIGAIAGGIIGTAVGWYEGYMLQKMLNPEDTHKFNSYSKEGSTSPDIRGAENQPLIGNNFPYVIGRHLVTPFIIGSPYTEYTGLMGKDAVIRMLLCVGYAPLKITDIKFGDTYVAYNRSHSGTERVTLTHGLLKGNSPEDAEIADSGDIIDYFKSNDVEIEILQQHPDAAVDHGTIYPDKIVDQEVNANILFVADGQLNELQTVNYKGRTFPNGYRTNTVRFTEACPMEFSIVLDAPSGLYGTRTDTFAGSQVVYEDIPLSFAVQWRAYDIANTSSDSNGSDWNETSLTTTSNLSINQWHDDWDSISDGVTPVIYDMDRFNAERNAHKGSTYDVSILTGMQKMYTSAGYDAIGKLAAGRDLKDNLYIADTGNTVIRMETNTSKVTDVYLPSFSNMPFRFNAIYSEVNINGLWVKCIRFVTAYAYNIRKAKIWGRPIGEMISNLMGGQDGYGLAISLTRTKEAISEDGWYALTTGSMSTYATETNELFPFKQVRVRDIIYNGVGKPLTYTAEKDIWISGIMMDFVVSYCKMIETNGVLQTWANKRVFSVGYATGEDKLSQKRFTFKKTLTKEQCKQLLGGSNSTKSIEIRVLRLTPNYKNQTENQASSSGIGGTSYSDNVVWSSVVTKVFDEDKLYDEDILQPVKAVKEKDLRKLCLIAVKAKADSSGVIEEQMKKVNCIAESISPYYSSVDHKWFPENITRVSSYYKPSGNGGWTSITKEEYLSGRQAGLDYYKEKNGTDYGDKMLRIALTDNGLHNEKQSYILSVEANNHVVQNAASGFLLSCVGPQNGPMAMGYDEINMLSLTDWYEFNEDVTDGSYHTRNITTETETIIMGTERHFKMNANAYIYKGQKLENLLSKLAICGRACYTVDEASRIKIIIDRPVPYPKGVINQQNCISGTNTYSWTEPPAGLQFNYNDENDGYESNVLYCWNDNNTINDYKGEVISYSIDYVTNPYQMWTLGRWVLASKKLQREILTRKVGLEGKTYALGDVLSVQDPTLMIGDGSARVQEVIIHNGYIYGIVTDATYEYKGLKDDEGNITQGVSIFQSKQFGKSREVTLRLSEPKDIVFNEGTSNEVRYSMKVGTTNVILFDNPVQKYEGDDPSATLTYQKYQFKTGDIVLFGDYGYISQLYRITKIKPERDGSVTETLTPYYEEVYRYGTAMPAFQSVMTIPSAVKESYDLVEVPSTVSELEEANNKVLLQASQIVEQTVDLNKYILDISPESQSIPVTTKGEIGEDWFYINAYLYYMDRAIEDNIVFSCSLPDGSEVGFWTGNKCRISTSYLTGDILYFTVKAIYSPEGLDPITKEVQGELHKLYSQALDFYKLEFLDGEKIRVDADGKTKDPAQLRVNKKVKNASGENITKYGRLTYEICPDGEELDYESYSRVTETETFSETKTYFKKMKPILLSLGNGFVLGDEAGNGGMFFIRDKE